MCIYVVCNVKCTLYCTVCTIMYMYTGDHLVYLCTFCNILYIIILPACYFGVQCVIWCTADTVMFTVWAVICTPCLSCLQSRLSVVYHVCHVYSLGCQLFSVCCHVYYPTLACVQSLLSSIRSMLSSIQSMLLDIQSMLSGVQSMLSSVQSMLSSVQSMLSCVQSMLSDVQSMLSCWPFLRCSVMSNMMLQACRLSANVKHKHYIHLPRHVKPVRCHLSPDSVWALLLLTDRFVNQRH